jgi:hypothetical protein
MSEQEFVEPEWELRSLHNAYEEREPTRYIVNKFFATHTLNVVYGSPGSMKSMILADMAAHVAAGTDWLPGVETGGRGIEVEKNAVFWLDMDNGGRRTDERFGAIARAGNLDADLPLFYISMPNPALIAHDIDSMLLFRNVIEHNEARLVVVDNLGLITGDIEENSAMMAIVMGNLRTVAERTGAALVLVHHQRKGGSAGGRAGDALRGHSSIEAALDLALHIAREPNSPEVTIRSTKTRGVDVPTLTARFNYEHLEGTSDLHKAWFDGLPVARGDNPVRDAILGALKVNGTMTKGRLADMVYKQLQGEYGKNGIRNWIADMAEVTEEIESKKGKHGAQILSLKMI